MRDLGPGPGYDNAMKSATKAQQDEAANAAKQAEMQKGLGLASAAMAQQVVAGSQNKQAQEEEKRRAAMAQLMSFANSGPTAGSIRVGF